MAWACGALSRPRFRRTTKKRAGAFGPARRFAVTSDRLPAAAAATTTTTTGAARLLFVRFVHAECSGFDLVPIEFRDSLLAAFLGHLDEAEAP